MIKGWIIGGVRMLMKVKDVMVEDVKTMSSGESILKATEMMNDSEIGCVIVTEKGKPVGIVTERDILNKVVFNRRNPAETKLKDVMSKPLVTVDPQVKITEAVQVMIRKKIKKLVVAKGDDLLGILSLTDLIQLASVTWVADSLQKTQLSMQE
jgi:CBS domain-containing protein